LIIYIVRHGETEYNKTKRIQGKQQIPLNINGRTQAVQAAESLRQYKITHVYCSGLIRAGETAAIINKYFSLPVVTDIRLNERDWGAWENRYYTEIPNLIQRTGTVWNEDNLDSSPHQGETTRQLMKRCAGFLNDVVKNHAASDAILVVTHGGPMRAIIGIVKGLEDESYLRQNIGNGQIMIVKYENSRFTIQ
jgi:broad specificity phosphatase PhoE